MRTWKVRFKSDLKNYINNMSEYDQFSEDWNKTRQKSWPEFELFLPQIQKGDRVLDLGCGNGRLRKFLPEDLVQRGAYFGFDISEKLLGIARKTFPKEAFFKGHFGKGLPFGADNFDWVFSIAAFHHLLTKKEQQTFFKETYRVLKPGGRVFITTWVLPPKYFWKNFWQGRVFTKNWIIPFGPEKHPRTYRNVTEKDLSKMLKSAGFEVIKSEKFGTRNYIALAKKLK